MKSEGSPKCSTGDLVTVKNMSRTDKFCIIAIKCNEDGEPIAVLKALFNNTFIIEKPISELNSLLIKGNL
ncbi:hypothetical protein ASZ90_019947 [hydrocarbon metagenome]|uniref:Uncharacterized protein n=1 Tax=hydrocarbon metagenome TaxID=938273 RepID=A0A0W8E212_9ZZZZ